MRMALPTMIAPHRNLDLQAPFPKHSASRGRIAVGPVLGGLHHVTSEQLKRGLTFCHPTPDSRPHLRNQLLGQRFSWPSVPLSTRPDTRDPQITERVRPSVDHQSAMSLGLVFT